MGWTVLYIAFGIVALWLLGEVLLQYKARLRWRVLAFTGFLCVVAGALIPSVLVIGVGIAAFATGQTFVTLSYRRGFVAGWALTGVPGVSRRREEEPEPLLEAAPKVDALEAPQPMPALMASGGYGSDGFAQGGPETNGFDTASFAAVDQMGAPSGFNGGNRYDTAGFPAVDAMSAPGGFGGQPDNGFDMPAGNRYDNPNGNGFDVPAFASMDAFGGPGGPGTLGGQSGLGGPGTLGGQSGLGGPNGFDGTQAFSPFSPDTEGYQTGGFPPQNGFAPQDFGQQQVPVYQPGPLPEEITGEFSLGGGGYDAFGGYPGPGQQQPGIYQDQPGQQQYAAFSDPYAAFESNGVAPGAPSYGGYDNFGGGYDSYGGYGGYGPGPGDQQGYGPQQSPYGVSDTFGGGGGIGAGGAGADAYGSMYGNGETYADGQPYFPQAPTGGAGAWVPQQRDPYEQMQQDQQGYPYQNNGDPYGYGAQGNGYGAQGNGYGYY